MIRCFAGVLLLGGFSFGQVVGPNINMVTGTSWPGGDPFLQRQNEPSMAVSSRNSLHLLAGANDYRTVDVPGVPGADEVGDAWLGVFRSVDGGLTWRSTLIPGYPQDNSPEGRTSPLRNMKAGADPVVRPGTNGMFYYGGLAFERGGASRSRIFLARYIDDNRASGGADNIRYVSASVVKEGDADHFQDKPAFIADIPRSTDKTCTIPGEVPQSFAAGRVYAAWTEFVAERAGESIKASRNSRILFSMSEDCGVNWTDPVAVSAEGTTSQGAALAVDQSTGSVIIVWRVFGPAGSRQGHALYIASTTDGRRFAPARKILDIDPFEQGTSNFSFRTNAYPAIAIAPNPNGGGNGMIFVAWAQRGEIPEPDAGGGARIVYIASSRNPSGYPWECIFSSQNPECVLGGVEWSAPRPIDNASPRGHQFMPALTYANGLLTAAWYDHRDTNVMSIYKSLGRGEYQKTADRVDGTAVYADFIVDPSVARPSARRHTLDVRVAQAVVAGGTAVFSPSVRVSRYAFGTRQSAPGVIQQLEADPPNLPMFQLGSVPFIGDYIDIAGATFVAKGDGTWRFNTEPTDPEHIHVTWTDNRNVVQPSDGKWSNYTPAALALGPSVYDESLTRPGCSIGQTGSRNQDVFTSRISRGLVVSAKSNVKELGNDPVRQEQLLQRAFPLTIQNTSSEARLYRLTILNQPTDGSATFLVYSPGGAAESSAPLDINVPSWSSVARSVFITSKNPSAAVLVEISELDNRGELRLGGVRARIALNYSGASQRVVDPSQRSKDQSEIRTPDISNPDISNPDILNPDILNPDISNPDISNPDILNPDILNPDILNPTFANPDILNPGIPNVRIANPDISNPDILNPDILNPDILNPDILNPDILNPDILNPDILNSVITDATWAVTNRGNTAVAYSVKLLQNTVVPDRVQLQLVVSKRYNTVAADGCSLKIRPAYVTLINQPSPKLSGVADLKRIEADSPSVSIAPGERVLITVRALDRTTGDPLVARLHYNPATAVTPVAVPDSPNTGTTDVDLALAISTVTLPVGRVGTPYSQALTAIGGVPGYIWALRTGAGLHPGLSLNAAGAISGTPTGAGTMEIGIEVTDATGRKAIKTLQLTIDPINPESIRIATASPLPPAVTGQAYAVILASTGGTGPNSWTVVSGILPAGLMLAGNGSLTGSPAADGIFQFAIRVTDAGGNSDSRSYSMIVRLGRTRIAAVRSTAPGMPAIAGGSWVSIVGSGLSTTTRHWNDSDFRGRQLPVALDGVRVTFGGVPAALSYVSPGEVRALCPNLNQVGPVEVELTGPRGTDKTTATLQSFAPAFFLFPDSYVAAVHADGAYVARTGTVIAGAPSVRPARPGETVMVFGSGFGPSTPEVDPGQVFEGAATLKNDVKATVNGLDAKLVFLGITRAGLYQFNLTVPEGLAAGDYELIAEIGGVRSPSSRFLSVGQAQPKAQPVAPSNP